VDADENVNCRQASRLLSLACERPLDANERSALRRHLDACFMCANFEAQLEFLHKASRRFGIGS
jgi:hypothetical protein